MDKVVFFVKYELSIFYVIQINVYLQKVTLHSRKYIVFVFSKLKNILLCS